MRVAFPIESTRFLEKLQYQILISPMLNSNDAGTNIFILKTHFDKTTGISKNLLLFRRNLLSLFSPKCFDFIFRFYSGNPIPFSAFSCTNITSLTDILRHLKINTCWFIYTCRFLFLENHRSHKTLDPCSYSRMFPAFRFHFRLSFPTA